MLDLARCEFIERKENVLALGNSGAGKTHIALALGLAACQKGFRVLISSTMTDRRTRAYNSTVLLTPQMFSCREDFMRPPGSVAGRWIGVPSG